MLKSEGEDRAGLGVCWRKCNEGALTTEPFVRKGLKCIKNRKEAMGCTETHEKGRKGYKQAQQGDLPLETGETGERYWIH